MNDYFFTLEVSNKNGENVKEVRSVASAENVEKAYEDVIEELCKKELSCRKIIDVKKL